jgi:hypothetical protein
MASYVNYGQRPYTIKVRAKPCLGHCHVFGRTIGEKILRWRVSPELRKKDRTLREMFGENGASGSNPARTTIQSTSFRTSRRIDRNSRVCARFAMKHGPGERPRRALNGGMRQNLSARYFARSMEVRPNIALVEGHGDSLLIVTRKPNVSLTVNRPHRVERLGK